MSQYDQLVLLYDQLNTMADEVNDLITRELFDDILTKMQTRERVFIQIKLAKKCANLSVSEESQVNSMESEVKRKEKANIELLQGNMAKVKSELDKLKLKNKLTQAYSQERNTQGSIIDVDDSYQPEEKNK